MIVDRDWPLALPEALDHGVPLFLAQVEDILRRMTAPPAASPVSLGQTATLHGSDLLALGFTVSQVVHAYGDICQVVTSLAVEDGIPISAEEFQVLNRCLDEAIAEAVTEHARQTAETRSNEEVERLGGLMHEVRNLLNTSLLAYQMLKRGDVAINGSTGAILGRSLVSLRQLVESTLADVRMEASHHQMRRISLSPLLRHLSEAGHLDAAHRGLRFSCEMPPVELFVNADSQLLESAVNNLLTNAFKYTRPGGTVVMRARRDASHVAIEVEDQCGGISPADRDLFKPFGDRRGHDRTGLGLGLSIARKAVRTGGGDIRIRNLPGEGCVFVVELPFAPEAVHGA